MSVTSPHLTSGTSAHASSAATMVAKCAGCSQSNSRPACRGKLVTQCLTSLCHSLMCADSASYTQVPPGQLCMDGTVKVSMCVVTNLADRRCGGCWWRWQCRACRETGLSLYPAALIAAGLPGLCHHCWPAPMRPAPGHTAAICINKVASFECVQLTGSLPCCKQTDHMWQHRMMLCDSHSSAMHAIQHTRG